jgi:hypothetical protein
VKLSLPWQKNTSFVSRRVTTENKNIVSRSCDITAVLYHSICNSSSPLLPVERVYAHGIICQI